MGAYIINIPDTVDRIIYVNVGPDSGRTYISSHRVEDLTPYTEPDMEQVRKEAYDKGYDDATAEIGSDEQAIAKKAYQKGLFDAWETARKICLDNDDGGIPASVVNDIFNVRYYRYALRDFSATEVIEKIRQYEQKKEEIKVGDEVIYNARRCVVLVTETHEKYGCVMDAEGERHGFENKDVEKTGRHFPEIAEVFAKMKETDNG